jgi:ubiquinone/menaquinone biosynthesis C-methylase UbiE
MMGLTGAKHFREKALAVADRSEREFIILVESAEPKESLEHTRQESHFRDIADAYVNSRRNIPATAAYHLYWEKLLQAKISSKFGPDARYLDPMCGAGLFLGLPISRFKEVYACDLSAEMLEYILPEDRERLAYCGKQDVRQLEFEDDFFDIILVRGGLHHVANYLDTVVAELYRVLKPGGQFIFSDPINISGPVTLVRTLLYTKTDIFEPDEERGLTLSEVKTLCAKAGFVNLTWEPFGHLAYVVIGNTDFFTLFSGIRHPKVIQALIQFDELSRKIPLWNRLCWIGNFSCMKPGASQP